MSGPPSPDHPSETPTFWRVGRSYRAPLLVQQLPPEVPFGFLSRILPTNETLELTLEAHPIPAADALAMLHGARSVADAELATGGNGGHTAELEVERASASELGHAIARRTQELWKVGLRFVVLASTRPNVEAKRARLSERLSTLGFRPRVPRYEVRTTLLPPELAGSEPRPSGYWHTLPTDGLASLFPFGDESVLEPGGILLGLALSDASPVFVERWSHASFSWGLFGTTGSGKSFAAALTLLRTRWLRPDTTIAILDPLGEYSALVTALGGSVIRVADGAGGRLNPLDPVTTSGDRREKAARVGTMLRALFPSLRDEEAAELDAAVTQLYEKGPEVPTLSDLRDRVVDRCGPEARLATLLEVFRSGSLRSLDGATTARPAEAIVSVDFQGVSDDQLPFHLTYVLDWAYGRLAQRSGRKLLLVDEAIFWHATRPRRSSSTGSCATFDTSRRGCSSSPRARMTSLSGPRADLCYGTSTRRRSCASLRSPPRRGISSDSRPRRPNGCPGPVSLERRGIRNRSGE